MFIDGLQKQIELRIFPPQRIISLVPSQTELLYDLGLDKEIVGITKFCVHPEQWKKEKTIIGGTKKIHFDKVKNLNPDLILANKEENTREIVEECSKIAPVYVTDIQSLEDAFEMIVNVGKLVDKYSTSQQLSMHIQEPFQSLKNRFSGTFLYFIWADPFMIAGEDTFIHAVLSHFGFKNACTSSNSRYPSLNKDEIENLNPEYIFLSSEPYPFKEKHIEIFKSILPDAKIHLVDGEMFSWYGSRMRYTCEYVSKMMG